jgi:hypothetical protein
VIHAEFGIKMAIIPESILDDSNIKVDNKNVDLRRYPGYVTLNEMVLLMRPGQ